MSELCKMHPRFSFFRSSRAFLPRMTFPKVRSALKKGRQNKASVDVPGVGNYKKSKDYPSVKAYRIEPTILSIGATRGEINFTDVRIYDRDRTICDVLRNMNKMDKELFNKAIQGYVNDPQKNVPNLIEYAKALRVWNKVKNLIGVWL